VRSFSELADAVVGELQRALLSAPETGVEALVEEIERAERVFVAGAGRSKLMVRAFCMRLMQMGKPCHVLGETATPAFGTGDLLLVASGSGATDSLVLLASKAKKRLGGRIALITATPGSPLTEVADTVIVISAPAWTAPATAGTRSIQPLGTVYEQSLLLALDILVMILMERQGVPVSAMQARHANLE
jgi:6-phospho-3-hexuloisomerase